MTPDGRFWFAAESLPAIELLYPQAHIEPPVALPPGAAIAVVDREEARRRLLQGHTEALGPTTAAEPGARTGLGETDARRGLEQIEAGGFVLRGRFTSAATRDGAEEWCDRRLLAGIHRYTLDRLRREIDPVSAQDYMRFLFRWQHVGTGRALSGRAGLRQAIARLEGFEAPAAEWEQAILPARVDDYSPQWLDELCLDGEVAWARLTPRRESGDPSGGPSEARSAATRATPISLALRAHLPALLSAVRLDGAGAAPPPERGAAAEIHAVLRERGALFFDEIARATRRLESDVERGLRELIASGFVTSDGFRGLRQIAGSRRRPGHRASSGRSVLRRPRRASVLTGGTSAAAGPAGRWALIDAAPGSDADGTLGDADVEALAEQVAGVLLERYGVVFRDAVVREPFALSWREVLRALRRMEARGVVRGGRFVSGFVGEQYALPDAVDSLRRVRREPRDGERVTLSASDPLNLTGIVLPGPRVASLPGRTVTFVDGAVEPAVEAAAAALVAGDSAG